jgi:Ca2+-binding EF-hand superfamily protein
LQKVTLLFNYYDRSGDGRIDYKEFTTILVEGGKTGADVEREAALDATRVKSKQVPQRDDDIISPQ